MTEPSERIAWRRRPAFYGGLMIAGFAAIGGLYVSDAIDATTATILMIATMMLSIPLVRITQQRQRDCGSASPAATRYTRRILASSLAYIVGLGIAVSIDSRMELSDAARFCIALLPVLPILGMVWTMARYLIEEQDEFLRHRAMIANIIGLGAVLSIGSFWGFLETFELVPHVEGWWAVPIWAIGMGAGQGIMALRDRAGGEQ